MATTSSDDVLGYAIKAVTDAGPYIVSKSRFDILGDIAADAYSDCPLHNWLGNGTYDADVSKRIKDITLRAMKDNAIIYADSEDMNGFAICLPPGFTGNKTIPFLLNGGLGLILHNGLGVIGRLQSYEICAKGLKKGITGNDNWYLFNLSVSKKNQGKGVATRLLTPMISFLYGIDKVAYVETNSITNVGLYQHFGFEVAKHGKVPNSDVEHFAMTRRVDKDR